MAFETPSPSPPLTVLMPVYNGARFLDEAIESVRKQTFTDFEFLIIDDGSSDETPEMLRRHAAFDPRIRILTQENRGLIATLNRGYQEAKGQLIARMDGDDVSYPRRLEVQMAFLESHPEIGVLGSAIDVINAEGRRVQQIHLPERPEQIRRHMRELGCALAHPTVLFRRQAVLDAGGLRRAYRHAEDYDLWLRVLETHDFANLSEAVLAYRRHDESVSSKYLVQQVLSSVCARLAAKRRLEGRSDPTSNLELVTFDVALSLGIDKQGLDNEMLRGLYEAADMAVAQGRRSAAAEFLALAQPFAAPDQLRRKAAELNHKAAKTAASTEEQLRHRKLLLDAAPDLYREVFGGAASARPVRCPVLPSPQRPTSDSLADIVKRHRYDTDKSDEYLHAYERAFAHLQSREIHLLELGVNRGGSLYMWRDYFPFASIIGVDLCPPADFSDATGRCRLVRCDQGDVSSLRALAYSSAPQGFHIIIDDASHVGALTAASFKTLFYDHLKPGGFYAVEDWGTGYWNSWPDGASPNMASEPAFPQFGSHFPSHDMGMVGFIKQLVDECALSDILHPRFGLPAIRKSWIRAMHLQAGLIIIEKSLG